MKRRALGLDISDDFVAAVIVNQTGSERRLTACAFHERKGEEVGAFLPGLLDRIGWEGGACACGISLAGVSVRNLSLPFTDRKKLEQVLPLELEDQLLTPVADQAVEYLLTNGGDSSSSLLVVAVEKELLHRQLESLAAAGLSPDFLTLRNMALAEMLVRSGNMPADFMLLNAGLQALSMVLIRGGQLVVVRHLPYPDRIYTEAPFSFNDGIASIVHPVEAMACISAICEDIRRSLGFFRLESGIAVEPSQVVLTGSMLHIDELRAKISEELGQEVVSCSLKQEAGVTLAAEIREEWQPALFDHALALALQALRKKAVVNFRKDEFAPEGLRFTSRPRLIGAAAFAILLLVGTALYLGLDYRSLRQRHDALGAKMEGLYKETFPEASKVVDPLTQMQASIRDIQAPAIATPVFSGDKRVLNILADVSARIPKELTIHVTRLVIDQDSVQIKGDTDTFNNVNVIQGHLRKSPLFDNVSIISAAADKEGSMIRFELRLEAGGAT